MRSANVIADGAASAPALPSRLVQVVVVVPT